MTDRGIGDAIASVVVGFAQELRGTGVDVPASAVLDAVAAVTAVDLGNRAEIRVALAATLVKRGHDLGAFDVAFRRWFDGAGRPPAAPAPAPGGAVGAGRAATAPRERDDHLRDELVAALAAGDTGALAALAARAVDRWGGVGTVAGGARYHLQRVLRALDLSAIAQDAVRAGRADGARREGFDEQLARADVQAQVERFRELLVAEIATARGAAARRDATGRVDVEPARFAIEDADLLRASHQELQAMRAAIRPLARQLAARLAHRQRRHPVGRVDMRRTLRSSLDSGGVPFEPALRRRRRVKPELWLLCDVSGSVAEFAGFTMAFVTAVHEELAGLRTFVFVDEVEEITDVLDRRVHDVDPYALLARASGAGRNRHSDYGAVLRSFLDRFGSELTPRATVLVTGDARTHHLDPGVDALRAIRHRCRALWFLNPEPRARWDQGDSAASVYADACDHMAEVRNLRQLAACVTDLL